MPPPAAAQSLSSASGSVASPAEERVYNRRPRSLGLPPAVPGMRADELLPPADCESEPYCVPPQLGSAQTGSDQLALPAAAPEPSNEAGVNPVLRWKSYSGNSRAASGVCSLKPSCKSGVDSKGKLVINLSGSPRSLLKMSPVALKMKANTLDDKSQTKHPMSPSGAGQVLSSDRAPESITNTSTGSDCSLPPGFEPVNQSTDRSSTGDTAISELVKKVRLRVKRVRLPVKPNVFQKKDEESEGRQPAKGGSHVEGQCVEGSTDVDAHNVENIEAAERSSQLEPPESTKVAELADNAEGNETVQKDAQFVAHDPSGTSSYEGTRRSEDGGMTAAPLSGHKEPESIFNGRSRGLTAAPLSSRIEVESYVNRRSQIPTIARSAFEADAPHSSLGLPPVAMDSGNEVSTTSNHVDLQEACGLKAVVPDAQNMDCQPVLLEKADQCDISCRTIGSIAPANISVDLVDGRDSDNAYSRVPTISVEEAPMQSTAKDLKALSTRPKHSTTDPGITCSGSTVPLAAREICSATVHDGSASETLTLDIKERNVLETLLPEEPPGYSSAEVSESSHSCESDRADAESSQSEDSDAYSSQSEGSESAETESSHSQDFERADTGNVCKRFSPGTPGRGTYFTEQVPSVLCDAEGNVWHVGKRAEKARCNEEGPALFPSNTLAAEKLPSAPGSYCDHSENHEPHHSPEPDSVPEPVAARESVTFVQSIQLNWKWPTDSDLSFETTRSVVGKEKSVFVGCIPDGIENIGVILESLMDKFLERFDFAPATLGEIQVVKVLKDFAFVELSTEKVAQIVLGANQLDVFEWGVNGFHFNIEGCKGTHTSVRPLIEYMPLKPARVIFVGNIPKSRWQKEYLEVFFSKILQGSDGSMDLKFVVSVYLLPESCDDYLELASELIGDALVFKCTKNPQLLKDIGEDVFICRDTSSVPLMSRHSSVICPQRSLFVGIFPGGDDFKIDCVRKVFEDILLLISRKSNQGGYLEYISVQPGTDYAFFQFNSEATADAVMDEYIENTQLFLPKDSPVSYIILRSPEYVRPWARYRSGNNRRGQSGRPDSVPDQCQTNEIPSKQAWRSDADRERQSHMTQRLSRSRSTCSDLPSNITPVPRRFGDEPGKKPDCVMSIGVFPLPLASWNGLSAAGVCSADPECMIIVEGLAKGLSHKLLRGALNELFERTLCHTGLLEVGNLVVRYLTTTFPTTRRPDEHLNIVACLPNAKVAHALLSMRKVFLIAGNEVRLFPKDRRKAFHWRVNSVDVPGGLGELSCLTDEEGSYRSSDWSGPGFLRERKRVHLDPETQHLSSYDSFGRLPPMRRKNSGFCTDGWHQNEGFRSVSPVSRQEFGGYCKDRNVGIEHHRSWNGHRHDDRLQIPTTEESLWQGGNPKGKFSPAFKGAGFSKFENRSMMQEAGMKMKKKPVKDVLKKVSKDGKRKMRNAGLPFVIEGGKLVEKGNGMRVSNRKRMRMEMGLDGPMHLVQDRFRKQARYDGVARPKFF